MTGTRLSIVKCIISFNSHKPCKNHYSYRCILIGSGKLHDSILIRYDLLVSPKILSSLQGMGHVHYDIRKEEAGLLRNPEEKKSQITVKKRRITKVKLY